MNAKYSVVDYRSKGQKVKDFCAVAPNIYWSIFSEALVIKAVNLSDLPAFVISSDQSDSVSIPHLKCQEQKECLYRVEASINEIAHENVVGLWAVTSHLEELHQIVELAVNISANLEKKLEIMILLTVIGELMF